MITRVGVAPRKTGWASDAFQEHWAGPHGDVVTHLDELKRYWQNHAILSANGETVLPWPGFDACSDLDFPSFNAMEAAFAGTAYKQAVKADEDRFVEKSRGGLLLGERHVLSQSLDLEHVRFMRFLRAAPGVEASKFADELLACPKPAEASGREVILALAPDLVGGMRSMFDAVECLWFETGQAACDFAVSAAARERWSPLAGMVRGSEYLVSRTRVII